MLVRSVITHIATEPMACLLQQRQAHLWPLETPSEPQPQAVYLWLPWGSSLGGRSLPRPQAAPVKRMTGRRPWPGERAKTGNGWGSGKPPPGASRRVRRGAGGPGRRGNQLLPAMLACLSPALHCKNKWKKHTPDRKKKGGKKKKPQTAPHGAPSAGLGQGLGLGYSLPLLPGKLLEPNLHLPQTETTQCHNPSPVILPSLPPPTSDTHTR